MIAASELILNPDGSVYHLGVKPEDVADTIITVGDPDRVPLVSQYLDEIEFKKNRRELVTHTGRLGKKRITILSTGMGTDNIDIVLNELDALFNINLESREIKKDITKLKIIRLGTSGAISDKIPLDTLIASEYAIGYDGLLGFYQLPAHPLSNVHVPEIGGNKGYIVPGSAALLNQLPDLFVKGVTYTAAGFYAPQGRIIRASVIHPHLLETLGNISLPGDRYITNIEMETSGLYGLGYALGHEVLSISVLIANRIKGTFSSQPEVAIHQMIESSLESIISF